MRAYLTTDVETTKLIFRDGFTDFHQFVAHKVDGSGIVELLGVYFATRQLDANDGFDGPVTLCLDIPEELFKKVETTDPLQEASGYRMAIIPAAELNLLGKPQVYDHFYAGLLRRDLVRGGQDLGVCFKRSISGGPGDARRRGLLRQHRVDDPAKVAGRHYAPLTGPTSANRPGSPGRFA